MWYVSDTNRAVQARELLDALNFGFNKKRDIVLSL